jgi:hypothetical protein
LKHWWVGDIEVDTFSSFVHLLQSSMQLDGQSVLKLQLLLLAFRAKLLFQKMHVTQHGRSQVRIAAPNNLLQQQQDIDGLQGQLSLSARHDQLLQAYGCKDADMTTLEQQLLEAAPHIG